MCGGHDGDGQDCAPPEQISGGRRDQRAYRRRPLDLETYLAEPYVMLGLNVVAGETDAEARRLFT